MAAFWRLRTSEWNNEHREQRLDWAERETLEPAVLNGMSSPKPSPQGSRIYAKEEPERLQGSEVTDDPKEQCLPDRHVNSEIMAPSPRLAHGQATLL